MLGSLARKEVYGRISRFLLVYNFAYIWYVEEAEGQ